MMEEIAILSDSTGDDPLNTKSNNNNTNQISSSSQMSDSNESGFFNETSRLQALELEQEHLNASLMALTTHFGQVQFRLKQIVAAPEQDKEKLLKELEEFAFRGCPNLDNHNLSTNIHEHIIEEQRMKQKNLIDQLKEQLVDLENYAYKSGEQDEMPSNLVIEKQKVIIDELKEKINLPLENLDKLSNDELKKVVDNAIFQIVNPSKVKEQLVSQLKTQIEDLERFIDFLHGEASSPGPYIKKKQCNCKNGCDEEESAFPIFNQPKKSNNKNENNVEASSSSDTNNQSTIDLLKKVLSVMQIFAITQLTCGSKNNQTFEKNSLKKTSNHWGDLRANLELAINKILKLNSNYIESKRFNRLSLSSNLNDDSDEELKECPHDLLRVIRKEFACSLRDLMQHGLVEVSYGGASSLVPFGCFSVRSKDNQSQMHIWELLLKYYELKHGKEYTQSAANKLSQSFSLNVVGGKVITIKQSLLNSIETIMRIHKYDATNKDSCFKAFVCLALNEKKLTLYLKQILKATVLIENNYLNTSYIKTTGFDDALKSIDQLKVLNWNLPVEKSNRRKSSSSNNKSKELF
ncbi:unnamed protein product [Brachionus calyciflorus]|uniref:RUN domain-containing protein n=1 Tax=Brachionus calyciflorus TaxID=104777 RepID=A0A813YU63_9BILA|nr:unnamed protein product [Brachionus calyciflorus]